MAGPVQIDPVNGGEFAAEYSNIQQGVFLQSGAAYAVLTNFNVCEVFRSADGGATWTVQDEGNEPSGGVSSATYWFDGVSTITVAYVIGGGGADVPIIVATFDTGTNTWTNPAAVGVPPSISVVRAIFVRSTGDIVVAGEGAAVASGMAVFIESGGAWTTIDLGANILTGIVGGAAAKSGGSGSTFCTANDELYAFIGCQGGTGWNNPGVIFQQFTAANSLGNFFEFPNQIFAPVNEQDMRCSDGPVQGPPTYCGAGNIVVGIARQNPAVFPTESNYATVYVTTDLGATWTEATGPGMDPSVSSHTTSDNLQFAPMSFFDGVNLWCIYARIASFIVPSSQVRLCNTVPNFGASPDTWSWNAKTAETITQLPGQIPGVNGFSFPKFTVQSGEPLLSTDIVGGGNLTAWFIPFAFGPSGRVHGTFYGFMLQGQFSGGTK